MKTKIIKSKYFILGLIVGLSLLGTGVYASVTGAGTLGGLFERLGTPGAYYYRLIGDNIKDNTVDSSEIEDYSIAQIDLNTSLNTSINQIATNKTDIAIINNKVNLGSNWTIVANGDNLEFRYDNVKKITFTKDGDIVANQYTY